MAFPIDSRIGIIAVVLAAVVASCTCSNDLVTPREVEPATRATIRIVHASPDASVLTCRQNDKLLVDRITYADAVMAPVVLPSELRNLRFTAQSSEVVLSVNVDLAADRQHTFVVLDSVERIRGLLLTDTTPPVRDGRTLVRIVHADVASRNLVVVDPSGEGSIGFAQAGAWHDVAAGQALSIRRDDGSTVTIPAPNVVQRKALTVVVRDPNGPGPALVLLDTP
jgi:hypothetical protein